MGTRSLTIVKNDENKDICVMYRQFDGYPCVHGQELVDWLKGSVVVNGLMTDGVKKKHNGMGCLAASLVAAFKDGPGGIYLEPSGTRDVGEEFVYTIYKRDGRLRLHVAYYRELKWEGFVDDVDDLDALCYPDEEEDTA